MRPGICLPFLLLGTLACPQPASLPSMIATDLRCEYRTDPLGVDVQRPRLSWALLGTPGKRDEHQKSFRILVASSAATLRTNRGDLWDSGTVESALQNNIPYAGRPLKPGQKCFWKVRVAPGKWSRPASFEMGLLGNKEWTGNWIDDGKSNPAAEGDFYKEDPAPLFRKEFSVHNSVARARLYISGLGYYEARLNGKPVGDHLLDPGWTRFDKRTNYSVYDVTAQIRRGDNCMGVMVGNGWYNPLPLKLFGSFNLRDHLPTGRPRLIAQLEIEFRDGSKQTVSTDNTWKVGQGPILRNNVYLGEVYDARKELPGWDRPGFDDSTWRAAASPKEKVGTLVAQPQPPIRATSEWKARSVTEPKPGVYIYDLGVNFAGWVSLRLNVARGTSLTLRYGELLHPDGTLNPMTSVAGQLKGYRQGTTESPGGPGAPEVALQSDTYIASGGEETYHPKFTFHGFRYVEITGLKKPLPIESVTAMRLNSDVEDAGTFDCSNPMLNQIQAMCRRTFKSNIFSVQSDCPHRERLGYGGDIVATSEAFMRNFDMAGFYEKVVRDWADSALPDGMFTDTAPYIGIQYCGVIWAMAHPLLIEQLHQYYGDTRIGSEQYEAAKRWLLLVERQYPDGIVKDGLSDHESLTENPSPELVTPMYYQCANLLARKAHRLGRSGDNKHFQRLAQKVKAAYRARFIDVSSGKVGPGTQTSQSFALYTGIAPESARGKILDYLVQNIHEHKDHLTTGILGTKFMLDVLSREGRADLAYKIVTQPDFPSWGWMLKNGATTLWEHWEYSDNTYSHNHPMFGSVSQWMMGWLGGIQPAPDAVGFDRIVIQPQTPKGLDWVKTSYKSMRGKIESSWTRSGRNLKFEFSIPPNTSARIALPAESAGEISKVGRDIAKVGRSDGNRVEFTVGSGHYTFKLPSH